MAGSIELSNQGITSPFLVEKATPPPAETPAAVSQIRPPPEAPPERNSMPVEKQAVDDLASALNSVSKAVDRNLQFTVNEDTGRIVIKVTDGDTGEVIRVIPPDEMSKMRDSFGSLVGLLFSDAS